MISMIYIVVLSFLLAEFQTNVHVCSCVQQNNCSYVSSPEQLRVALRGPDTVTISWRTNGTSNGSNDTSIPQVLYSTNSSLHSGIVVNGTSSTYTNVGIISWFHDVVLNVNYSTKYYYQVLASLCVNHSEIHSFTSQPAFGNSSAINITIVGNMGVSLDDQLNDAFDATVNAFVNISSSTNLFLQAGGFAFADTDLFGNVSATYESIWNQFQNQMQQVTADNIYMTAPGVHEVTCVETYDCICKRNIDRNITSQYRNFSAYLHRFSMPGGEQNDTYKNLWYSFDYGLAHIIIINTETDFDGAPAGPNKSLNGGDFRPEGVQIDWLKRDLEAAERRRCHVPWIIVIGHRPWYGTTPVHTPFDPFNRYNCDSCKNAFANIIFKSVDFYFSGYMKWYQRLYPVTPTGEKATDSYIEPESPIYITSGIGGSPGARDVWLFRNKATALLNNTTGFSQLQLVNSSVAKLYFYQSSDLQELDNITIIRTHNCTNSTTSCRN